MLAAVPSLRAFAISLSGNVDRADDLVQDTLLRAMANIDSFTAGTNMSAWLFTILRNLFRSEYRKRRREVEDADGHHVDSLKSPPQQHSRLEFEEFRRALATLLPDQREALILVGAAGFSHEEAAAICEAPVGTIKSRVNRARGRTLEAAFHRQRRHVRPGQHDPCRSDREQAWLTGSSVRRRMLPIEIGVVSALPPGGPSQIFLCAVGMAIIFPPRPA